MHTWGAAAILAPAAALGLLGSFEWRFAALGAPDVEPRVAG
jgi:hypothetical protein